MTIHDDEISRIKITIEKNRLNGPIQLEANPLTELELVQCH